MWIKGVSLSLILALSLMVPGCCFLHPSFRATPNPTPYFIGTSVPATWVPHIQAAANTWSSSSAGSFSFTFGGITTTQGFVRDGVRSIFVENLGSPILLAEARPTDLGFCVVQEQEIGFNSIQPWATDGFNHYDVQTVALHEFGHWIVLLHVICPDSSVMRAAYDRIQRNLSTCDRVGIQAINRFLPPCFPGLGICFSFFSANENAEKSFTAGELARIASENAEELEKIWLGNDKLRSDAEALGNFYRPIFEDWTLNGPQAASTTFTTARYEEINNLINLVYPDASVALQTDLNTLRSFLQGKIGMTLEQIFSDEYKYAPEISYQIQPKKGTTLASLMSKQLLLMLASMAMAETSPGECGCGNKKKGS